MLKILGLSADSQGYALPAQRALVARQHERLLVEVAGTGAELASADFSARPQRDVSRELITARYRAGQNAYHLEIDTSRPVTATLTAIGPAPAMQAVGKPLAEDVGIHVLDDPFWWCSPAEGQLDATMCWGACLAWWSTAAPDRSELKQKDLMAAAAGLWSRDGSIQVEPLRALIARNRQGLRMTTELIHPARLRRLIDRACWPLLIGFKAPGGFGHMNVIYGTSSDHKQLWVMEPWFPDPGNDPAWRIDLFEGQPVVNSVATGEPFKFKGAHLDRAFEYYGNSPLRFGFFVGYPEEYRHLRLG